VEGLLQAGYSFDAFVCLSPRQAEEYSVSGYFDYRPMAKQYDIPLYIPETYSLSSKTDQAFFEEQKFDLLIQGGWQRLFPEAVLKTLSIGALGLHGSADLLPKGRGRSPLNWSLIEGRKRFLMHIFLIRPGVDDGDVLAVKDFDITPFDDIQTLYFKYAIVYRGLLLDKLPSILDRTASVISQVGEPSYYPKRAAQDGRIDWESMDVWQIHDFVRAQSHPYPGAFGAVGKQILRIWKARPFDTRIRYDQAAYGEIVEQFDDKLLINCLGGLLLVDEWEAV
jgi:methionyl-tRNA formyltransferase